MNAAIPAQRRFEKLDAGVSVGDLLINSSLVDPAWAALDDRQVKPKRDLKLIQYLVSRLGALGLLFLLLTELQGTQSPM